MLDLNNAIAKLLSGASAEDVIAEDIDKTGAHIAAMLMKQGMSKEEAIKKAKSYTGYQPDEDLLHIATVGHNGPPKGEPVSIHHVKQHKKD